MKTTKRILATVIVFVLLAGTLVGCGKKFDASGCVDAFMKLVTTGDTSGYVEYTGQTEEDAKADYEEMLNAMSSELESAGVTGDAKDEILDIYIELLSKAKYTVKEAVETDNGFEVDVEIEPITGLYDGLIEEIQTEGQEYFQAAAENGEAFDQDTIMEWMFGKMAEKMRERLDTISYGDPTTVTVHLNKVNGNYEIDDADGVTIGETLIDISGIY